MLVCAPAFAAPPSHIPPGFERVWEVQERHQNGLLKRLGVVGVALGENAAGQPVVQILTDRPRVEGLPAVLDNERVEVVMTGRFQSGEVTEPQAGASAPTDRWPRPVPIGVSIAHQDVTAGTIGCQVWQAGGCHTTFFVLSNNHVLANSNYANGGEPILQPGPADGGVLPDDRIGLLADFQVIEKTTTANNIMDAALAWVSTEDTDYRTPPDGYGAPRFSTLTPTINMPVKKYGRTTRTTTGRVSSINAVIHVTYTGGTAQFVQQFIVLGDNNAPFSQPGDSGALVVRSGGSNDRKTVGLLFAGSGNYTAVNPINPILQRFGVTISGEP